MQRRRPPATVLGSLTHRFGGIRVPLTRGDAMRRRLLAALMAGAMMFGAVACDDNGQEDTSIDEDDSRLGPGDGNDEVGPGR